MKQSFFTPRRIAVTGMLSALIVVLSLSGLGIIEVPGLAIRVTILHIPVIIGAILEGPVIGGFIGFFFGLWSILDKVLRPTPTGFVFFHPLVSVLPRLLIGVIAYYSYRFLERFLPRPAGLAASAFISSALHTVMVLSAIYIFYAKEYMEVLGQSAAAAKTFLGAVAVTNGVPEAIAAAVIVPLVVLGISRLNKKS